MSILASGTIDLSVEGVQTVSVPFAKFVVTGLIFADQVGQAYLTINDNPQVGANKLWAGKNAHNLGEDPYIPVGQRVATTGTVYVQVQQPKPGASMTLIVLGEIIP